MSWNWKERLRGVIHVYCAAVILSTCIVCEWNKKNCLSLRTAVVLLYFLQIDQYLNENESPLDDLKQLSDKYCSEETPATCGHIFEIIAKRNYVSFSVFIHIFIICKFRPTVLFWKFCTMSRIVDPFTISLVQQKWEFSSLPPISDIGKKALSALLVCFC